jgi:hypothetical protein
VASRALVGSPSALALLAGSLFVPSGPSRGLAAQGLDLTFRQGYDSNVFQVPPSLDSVRVEGIYLRARAIYPLDVSLGGLTLALHPGGRLEWVPGNSRANAYEADASATIRYDWRNPGGSRRALRRVMIQVEGSGSYGLALPSQSQSREEFHAGVPLDATVAFTELPNRREGGGDVQLRVYLGRILEFRMGALAGDATYQAPSGATVDPSSIDRSETGLFGRAILHVGSLAEVETRWRAREILYPNQDAREKDGSRAVGVSRAYRQDDLSVIIALSGAGGSNRLFGTRTRRHDLHAGYYDYEEVELGDELRFGLSRHVVLSLRFAERWRDYGRYALLGKEARNRYRDGTVSLDLLTGSNANVVLGASYERVQSRDTRLEYERIDAFVELKVRR